MVQAAKPATAHYASTTDLLNLFGHSNALRLLRGVVFRAAKNHSYLWKVPLQVPNCEKAGKVWDDAGKKCVEEQ